MIRRRYWNFMRPFSIRRQDGSVYLWRLRVLETPWFGIKLHWIKGADADRVCHDHPWPFVSFILWGSYVERLGDGSERRVRWFNRKRALDLHRITSVSEGGAWTLVFNGRYGREWGFQTPHGWVQWDQYWPRA